MLSLSDRGMERHVSTLIATAFQMVSNMSPAVLCDLPSVLWQTRRNNWITVVRRSCSNSRCAWAMRTFRFWSAASLTEASTHESAKGQTTVTSHVSHPMWAACLLSTAQTWGRQDVCRLIWLIHGAWWRKGMQRQKNGQLRRLMHGAWPRSASLQTKLCTPLPLSK